MSGVQRFLSRREKKHQSHTEEAKKPDHFGGVFTLEDDLKKKPDKEEDKKIKAVLERLRHYGIDTMVETNVRYALRAQSSHGDAEEAFRLLMLLQDTYEGIVRPYVPDVKLVGAVNRGGVSCYMDALLFSMFARLDSFEAMLYENFADMKRKRMAGLLRLWVNMLRTGRLITIDITAHLQNAMADCGWLDAGKVMQHDPSEAFTFITGQLELPLLTLKMDLFHTGKEDPADDHKFVNERLLEVAIPDEPSEGEPVITLEECLEQYFNNRIEVKRHLENQRRNTLKSATSADESTSAEKEAGMHIEEVELASESETPTVQTPMTETPTQSKSPLDRALRPTAGRKRADSIFSQRKVELTGVDPSTLNPEDPDVKQRKMSMRTEVLMPAWQFFKLLPWYTDHLPTSDAQVAAHFSNKRPVLGICLKRYSYTTTGQATRRDTYVDIPLEIGVPDFMSDDNMQDHGPITGNFRLMLQSVVCHRGVSVNSGHYITLCRGKATSARPREDLNERSHSGSDISDLDDPWMRFDDLARERVTNVDIRDALRHETPYLLFYQVQPIGEDGHSIHELPSYSEAMSGSQPELNVPEKSLSNERSASESTMGGVLRDVPSHEQSRSEVADFAHGSTRTSLDANVTFDAPRGRRSTSGTDESSVSGGSIPNSIPTTPSDEKTGGFLSVIGSRRNSRPSKNNSISRSRPTSVGPQGETLASNNNSNSRFSLNMTKLTQRMSRVDMPTNTTIQPSEAVAAELAGQRDVTDSNKAPATATVVAIPSSDSKETVATVKPVSAKTIKKEKAAEKKMKHSTHHHHGLHAHSGAKGQQDDRDCVVM